MSPFILFVHTALGVLGCPWCVHRFFSFLFCFIYTPFLHIPTVYKKLRHVSWWGCYGLCLRRKPTKLAHSLFCSCVCFCLYGPFTCILFHEFSWQLSAFSLCSSGLISALLVLSTLYLLMKVSLNPDILCGWLGLKHQLTIISAWHSLSLCLQI